MVHLKELEPFHWVSLSKISTWSEVERAMDFIIKKGYFDAGLSSLLFDEYTKRLYYVTSEKIAEWNEKSLACNFRWVETFTIFKSNNLKHQNVGRIVEFCLCLPGTCISTRRTFVLAHGKNLDIAKNSIVYSNTRMNFNSQIQFKYELPRILWGV